VVQTYADIEESEKDLGYAPITSIDIGIPQFVDWFISYHS
jgi:UDP-glucuronate 4-epimerase